MRPITHRSNVSSPEVDDCRLAAAAARENAVSCHLPDDLLSDILDRLGAQDLVEARQTCRSWAELGARSATKTWRSSVERKLAKEKDPGKFVGHLQVAARRGFLSHLRELTCTSSVAPPMSELVQILKEASCSSLVALRLAPRASLGLRDRVPSLWYNPDEHFSECSHDTRVGEAGARALAGARQLDRLEVLVLAYSKIGPAGVEAFVGAPHRKHLRVLDLTGCEIAAGGVRALAEAVHLGSLEKLGLGANGLMGGDAWPLVRATHLRGLRELDLSVNSLEESSGEALMAATHLTNLTTLLLSRNRLGFQGADYVTRAPHLRRLRLLDLSCNEIDDRYARTLAHATHLRDIQILDLEDNDLGASTVDALVRHLPFKALRGLCLGYNLIDDEGVRLLTEANFSELRFLDLFGNRLGCPSARSLAESRHLTKLSQLMLGRNRIDLDAMHSIFSSSALISLVDLDLSEIFPVPFDSRYQAAAPAWEACRSRKSVPVSSRRPSSGSYIWKFNVLACLSDA